MVIHAIPDSIEMNLSDNSSIAVVNSEVSGYNAEADSDNDVSPTNPYQFEPSAAFCIGVTVETVK